MITEEEMKKERKITEKAKEDSAYNKGYYEGWCDACDTIIDKVKRRKVKL